MEYKIGKVISQDEWERMQMEYEILVSQNHQLRNIIQHNEFYIKYKEMEPKYYKEQRERYNLQDKIREQESYIEWLREEKRKQKERANQLEKALHKKKLLIKQLKEDHTQ